LSLASNPFARQRCESLVAKGLLAGATTEEQAVNALAKLRAAGWEQDSDLLHACHYALATPAIAVTNANAHRRASVADNLCGFSFDATDGMGLPVPLAYASAAQLFAVANAQHFDSFLPLPGYDTRFVPLHVYFIRALDLMYEHLQAGAPLPPSQVVRTTPRGGASPALALQPKNVPDMATDPLPSDRILFRNRTLLIPD
jgi:hypothetical protein